MEGLTPGQQDAFDKFKIWFSMAGGGWFLLHGAAGTGKSYMLNTLLDHISNTTSQRVALSASTHKAAKVASDFANGASVFTAHSLLGLRESIGYHGELKFIPGDKYLEKASNYHTIIVDEVSMMDDIVFDGFEQLVADGKKIILIGDKYQIPPVSLGNSLPFDVPTQRELGFVVAELTEVVRQAAGSPIIQEATELRNTIFRPVLPFDYADKVSGLMAVRYAPNEPPGDLSEDVLEMFSSDHFRDNPDYCKVLAWRNKTVDDYNIQIRRKLFGSNCSKLMVGEKLTADAPFLEGKIPIMTNNEDMEVIGLTVGRDELSENDHLTIYKAHVRVYGMRGKTREVIIPIMHEDSEAQYDKYVALLASLAKLERKGSFQHKSRWQDYYKFKERYAHVKYSYAMTVHKAQGSTYHHAVVALWDIIFNRKTEERNRIIYTAVTRPKYTLKIIHGS